MIVSLLHSEKMSNNQWTEVIRSAIPWLGGVIIGSLVSYLILQTQVQPTEFTLESEDKKFSVNIKLQDGKVNFLNILDQALKKDKDKVINDLNLRGFHELNDDLFSTLQNKQQELLKRKIINLIKVYERPFTKNTHKFRNIESRQDMEEAVTNEIPFESDVAKSLRYYARSYKGAFKEPEEEIKIAISDQENVVQGNTAAVCPGHQFEGRRIFIRDSEYKVGYFLNVSASRSAIECRSNEEIEKSLLVSKEVGRCLLGKERFQARRIFESAKARIVSDTTVKDNGLGKTTDCK